MKLEQLDNPFVELANSREGVDGSRIPVLLRESYAQCGEDLIVEALLRARLKKQRRHRNSLTYIEIGANHPISTSNTYLFYAKYGAQGILVEADPALIRCLEQVRPRDNVMHLAVSASHTADIVLHIAALSELSSVRSGHTEHFKHIEGNVGVTSSLAVPNLHINEFLRRYAPRDIDFLSIDCEGIDVEIITKLNLQRFKPYVVQCEPSDHIIPGASKRIIKVMERRSYRLIAVTDVNLIFVRRKQASIQDIPLFERIRTFGARVRRRLARITQARRPST